MFRSYQTVCAGSPVEAIDGVLHSFVSRERTSDHPWGHSKPLAFFEKLVWTVSHRLNSRSKPMNLRHRAPLARNALCVASLAVLFACGNKNKDDDDGTMTSTPKTSTPAPTAPPAASTTEVKIDNGPNTKPAGVEAHVKAELDGRPDGITGVAATAAGAKAALQTPTGWKAAPGDIAVSTAADDKARLGVTSFTGDPSAKLAAAATAMGLTNCQWNTPAEAIVSGKDKLAATGADGVCSRGAGQAHAAYIAPTAEGLLVVGAWDPGGDMTNVFGSMRSIAKAAGGGDATGIAACCAALRQNAKSAPPQQAGAYLLAAGACDAVKNNPQGRAALGTVRAALAGASVPSTCK